MTAEIETALERFDAVLAEFRSHRWPVPDVLVARLRAAVAGASAETFCRLLGCDGSCGKIHTLPPTVWGVGTGREEGGNREGKSPPCLISGCPLHNAETR